MTQKTPTRKTSFILCFVLSFMASALTTLAICEIAPDGPVATSFLEQIPKS